MANRPTPLPRERTNPAGTLIVTPRHLAILLGLIDRPNGMAATDEDLAAAARPYLRYLMPDGASAGGIARAGAIINPLWVARNTQRYHGLYELLPRGRVIAEGKVPVHVTNFGPYTGMGSARARGVEANRKAAVENCIRLARENRSYDYLFILVDAMVLAWQRSPKSHGLTGMAASMWAGPRAIALKAWLERYVALRKALPTGMHDVARGFTVDFDPLWPERPKPRAPLAAEDSES